MWPPSATSAPPRTPLAFTFEDSDCESEIGLPNYEPMSPVVARLEKMAISHKSEEVEDSFTIDDCSSTEDCISIESKTLYEGGTSPESPIEAFLPRPETPKQDHCPWKSTTKFALRNGRVHTLEQLQVMALEIAEARHNGEFPLTTESTLNADAVAEDYKSLMYLRRIRGDLAAPAPESYIHLREQIALGIQQRQASRQCETRQEVARRVSHYLQAVKHEEQYYHAANTTIQRRAITKPIQLNYVDANEDMCSMVEHTIEHGIADATGPLRMNVGRLKQQGEVFQEQTGLLQQQTGALQKQGAVFQQQTSFLQQQTGALQRQTGALQEHTSVLRKHTGTLEQQIMWQASQQDRFFQQQLKIIEEQDKLFQRQGFSSRKESRFFDKQTGALKKHTGVLEKQTGILEQQNQSMRQNLEFHNASLTHLNNLVEPQVYNNQATAHNLASANQLINNLAEEFPKVIKKALDEAAQKQAHDLFQQAARVHEEALALAKTRSAAQLPVPPIEKVGQKKKFVEGSDGIERGERSSLYRMVCKFKRRRIARE
ncbi:hypothetical protein FHETE_4568 [Fusarium heterosporum]|uniref:Uncharacterized protein n=1 Tax=Fusarium heterosporum TaxID=42747 RepID=A0A8H5WU24_FUSHE|nr:hypothetical protein FHETE_4568 [Fusarium heterosporum]